MTVSFLWLRFGQFCNSSVFFSRVRHYFNSMRCIAIILKDDTLVKMQLYLSTQAVGKLPHNGHIRNTILWKTKLLSKLFNPQAALQISRTDFTCKTRSFYFFSILPFVYFCPLGSTSFLVSVLGCASCLSYQCDGVALLVSLRSVLALIQQQNC